MLILTGYGLLVGFAQNLLVFFAVPLLNFFQTPSSQNLTSLVADLSTSLQWIFAGFLAFLLMGFVVAFFFRRFKKWAWYGMNVIIGIAVLIVIAGAAFFYNLMENLNVAAIENRISVIKVLISLLSFVVILTGLAMIRGLNRKTVRQLFTG